MSKENSTDSETEPTDEETGADLTEPDEGTESDDPDTGTDTGGVRGTNGARGVDFDNIGRGSAGMDVDDVDQLFSILNGAIESSTLDQEDTERLLSVLESALVTPTRLSPTETDELFSVLESTVNDPANPEIVGEVLSLLNAAIVDPTQLDGTESEGLLSVFEAALVDPTDPASSAEDVFSLLNSALTNPGGLEGEDNAFTSLLSSAGIDLEEAENVSGPAGNILSLFNPSTGNRARANSRDRDESDIDDRDGDWDSRDGFRVARIAAAATQRTTDYSLRSGIRTGTSLVRAVSTAESPADLLEEVRTITFTEMDRLGFEVDEEYLDPEGNGDDWAKERVKTKEALRERGERLLEMSADVDYDEEIHPSYPGILDDLAADEARILRLLATQGPQPSLDVRDVGWVPIASELVAAGLTMVGSEAGLREEGRTPAYMNNLHRLGLIWFSDEQVENIKRYQVLEAQPQVEEAVNEAKRAKTNYRSVHLTPFGVDFCEVCMPFEVSADDACSVYRAPSHTPDSE